MTRARSARAVTALINRLQNPVPGAEYEHKQRLLGHARAHGAVTGPEGAVAIGHTTDKTARRLLDELVDEGLLARHTVRGVFVPAPAHTTR